MTSSTLLINYKCVDALIDSEDKQHTFSSRIPHGPASMEKGTFINNATMKCQDVMRYDNNYQNMLQANAVSSQ